MKKDRKEYMRKYYKEKLSTPEAKRKESRRKREYYKKNKDKVNERNKLWMEKNKQKFREYLSKYYEKEENIERRRKNSRRWYENQNKEQYRKNKRRWERIKVSNDLNFRMKKNLRLRVIQALEKYSKTGKIRKSKEYGIDYNGIIKKLMHELPTDFNNKVYEIDHIEPCCSFDLTDEEQIKICFSPKNHQWLEKEEHKKKSALDINKSLRIRGKNGI